MFEPVGLNAIFICLEDYIIIFITKYLKKRNNKTYNFKNTFY